MRVELNGVVFDGAGLLAVGTRFTTISNDRDGLFLRLGAATTGSFVGGANNDQLYAVASRGSSALAVGVTRTFRSAGRNADPSFFVTIPAVGAPTAVIHENMADLGLQPRAVDTTPTGYVVSGRFNDGAEGYVGLLSPTVQAQQTVRFAMPTFSDVRVRQVRSAGATIVVVGDVTSGAFQSGFVSAFDSSTLVHRWAFVVSVAGGSVNLADVAPAGTSMVAVGEVNNDGLVVQFDAVTGRQVVASRVAATSLTSVIGAAPALVTGVRAGSLFAARLTAAALEGTAFGALSNPSNISPLPVVRVDGGAVVFGRTADGGLAQVELNDDLRSGCAGAVSGTPLRLSLQGDAGVLVSAATPVVAAITVTRTAVAGLQVSPLTASPAAACWP